MPKKIFISGATGFLGSHLVKTLYNSGCDITILIHKNSSHPLLEWLRIRKKKGDVRNYNSVLKAMKGNDYVYHLAGLRSSYASKKEDIFDTNIFGTENVMKASLESGVKRVVHVSTSYVLGFSRSENVKLNENSNAIQNNGLYSKSKRIGEERVQKYVAKGLKAIVVNPCRIIGPGERYTGRLMKEISERRINFAPFQGECLVDVRDAVNGIILAMKKGKPGQRYILAGEFRTLKDQYNTIAGILNKPKIRLQFLRTAYYPAHFVARITDIFTARKGKAKAASPNFRFRDYDVTKAKKDLGWEPKIKFEESVRQSINYYKRQNLINTF